MNVAIFSILFIADKGEADGQSPVRVFVEFLMTEMNEDNTVQEWVSFWFI